MRAPFGFDVALPGPPLPLPEAEEQELCRADSGLDLR